MTITFIIAVIGWIIFRSENISQAVGFLESIATNKFFDVSMLHGKGFCLFGMGLLFVEWLQRDKQHALQIPHIWPFNYRLVRWCIYYLILLLIQQYSGTSQSFIYFQF